MPMIEITNEEYEERKHLQVLQELAAAGMRGDAAEVERWSRRLAVLAELLLIAKKVKGAEWVRNAPFDLSKAEAAYGRDWLES